MIHGLIPDVCPELRRIALVSEHASPLCALGDVDAGGQNVHVAELARHLGRLGHEVVVYTRRDAPRLGDVAMSPGVTVRHVDAGPPRSIPKDDLLSYMPEFARQLALDWAIDPPDVVHSHFWMSGYAATLATKVIKIPMVHTFHALGVVKLRHQGIADTSPAHRIRIERQLLRDAVLVIASCPDERAELAAMGADPARLRTVPSGVDTERFRPRHARPTSDDGSDDTALRVLSVGRLVPRKGVGELIEAVARVERCELTIVGGPAPDHLGDSDEAVRLAALAARLGASDRVRFVGHRSRDAVATLMREADVVACVPWYEPFGIVPLEAMACGVPVVASAVGGLVDSVVDGVTGLVVPPRDIDATAAALRRLRDDPTLAPQLGTYGRARATRRYQWSVIAERTAGIYRAALQSSAVEPVGALQ